MIHKYLFTEENFEHVVIIWRAKNVTFAVRAYL